MIKKEKFACFFKTCSKNKGQKLFKIETFLAFWSMAALDLRKKQESSFVYFLVPTILSTFFVWAGSESRNESAEMLKTVENKCAKMEGVGRRLGDVPDEYRGYCMIKFWGWGQGLTLPDEYRGYCQHIMFLFPWVTIVIVFF